MRTLFLVTLFLFTTAAEAATTPPVTTVDMNLLQRASRAFAAIAEQAKPAVVNVRVEKFRRNRTTTPRQPPRQRGRGSGFIISPEGLVLTSYHLVTSADSIRVTLADRREFIGELIGGDPGTDVALVKITNPEPAPPLPVLPLGDSSLLRPGEWVLAIGNPSGAAQTVTTGVVSATGNAPRGTTENFLQTDASINQENSGGPLINTNGEVVGINTVLPQEDGRPTEAGLAVPINTARGIKQQLLQSGRITRGWVGAVIEEITPDIAANFTLTETAGVLIRRIEPNSPAATAGLRPGDVITKVDTAPVSSIRRLRNSVGMLPPGTRTLFTVDRDGRKKLIPITIGERGKEERTAGTRSLPGADSTINRFGLVLRELSASGRNRYQPGSGLLIAEVTPGSPAARAGLSPGQLVEGINRQRIKKIEELNTMLGEVEQKEKLLLRVRDGEFSTFVVLRTQ